MKNINFFFLLLFTSISLCAQKTLSSPVHLITTLMDCPSQEKMEKVCNYYECTQTEDRDGFKTFTFPDGSVLKCKVDPDSTSRQVPTLSITSKDSKKQIEKILLQQRFEKISSNEFRKGSIHAKSQVVCLINKDNSITCTRKFK